MASSQVRQCSHLILHQSWLTVNRTRATMPNSGLVSRPNYTGNLVVLMCMCYFFFFLSLFENYFFWSVANYYCGP